IVGKVIARAHRDRVVRARLLAEPAVDTAEEVDLVALGVALARRDPVFGRVLGGFDQDAAARAGEGTQLPADTFLQAVGISMENVPAALPRRDRLLSLGILDRHERLGV